MLSEAAEKLAIEDQGMGLGTGVPRLEDRDIILKSALVALIQTKQSQDGDRDLAGWFSAKFSIPGTTVESWTMLQSTMSATIKQKDLDLDCSGREQGWQLRMPQSCCPAHQGNGSFSLH